MGFILWPELLFEDYLLFIIDYWVEREGWVHWNRLQRFGLQGALMRAEGIWSQRAIEENRGPRRRF